MEKTAGDNSQPQTPAQHAARSPSRAPSSQPPKLLRATHRRPLGLPGRALRGGRSGPCLEHSHGHGRRTPAPPQPTPTQQLRRLEHGSPPHPSRRLAPPLWPPPPGATAPGPPSSSPGAGSVGGDGTRGGSRLPRAHLPPIQHCLRPAERHTPPTQCAPLPPPSHTAEAPGGLSVFLTHRPGHPQCNHRRTGGPARLRQGPRGMPQRGASLAHPCPVTPTGTGDITDPRHRPGQEGQVRPGGPLARPPDRARHPDRDPGPATPHHPTSKAPGHTNKNTLTSAHHHHVTAAP